MNYSSYWDAVIEELILPSSLEALSLKGVLVENWNELLTRLPFLKRTELTVNVLTSDVPLLPLELHEYVAYKCAPDDLAHFSTQY